jgi:hypothetical protein
VKVLLVVIDAATPRVVCPAIQTGHLATMQRLVAAGALHQSSISIFPSITPAATAAIIVGAYPAVTGIVGASWYDEAENHIAYYGDDFWVVAREGFSAFLRDFLVRLNGDRLIAPTLFERVENAGLRAASINYLVFKGCVEHKVHTPLLLKLLPGVPMADVVKGPSIFCLGDFASTRTARGKSLHSRKGGALHRFGMDDAATGELLVELMADGLPDFTVAYFADNDYRSHEVGPYHALPTVEHVDRLLGAAFDAAGGLDRVLQDTYVVITSDHGHCEVLADPDRGAIRLHEILSDFTQAPLGKPWDDGHQIMICPNMRAAQIYLREVCQTLIEHVVSSVVGAPGVDHAMWRTSDLRTSGRGYTIRSAGGALEFWKGTDGSDRARDAFGTTWSWRGELTVVDAVIENGHLEWGDYPNAFDRIAGVLEHPHSGTIWVTAKPGREFEVPGGKAHLGGASHGGLHALESLSPVIVAGPARVGLPRHLRSIDLAPLCLSLLNLNVSAGEGL